MSDIYSDQMKRWHSSALRSLLIELAAANEPVYTHHFEMTFRDGRRHYEFVGKSSRSHLRKCLRTLEADGLIENINLGMNIHQWKITELGKQTAHEGK